MKESIVEPLTDIFRKLFEDESISLSADLTANDIDSWDSLNHMRLIHEVESKFEIRIPFAKLVDLKTVGDLVEIIDTLTKD